MKKIVIIVPAFNEEETIVETSKELSIVLEKLIKEKNANIQSKILFVDDGSKDDTWKKIKELKNKNKLITGIKLSRNFGHQNAVLAGLKTSSDAGYTITIDADLQDDPNKIIDMVNIAERDNVDVVYGVRNDRKTDSWFKKTSAQSFYKLMNILGAKTIANHADFRLISKRALEVLLTYRERRIFLRGLVTELGFKTAIVEYKRTPRTAGESKYPLKKMIAFAIDGVVSFSTKPIKIVINLGFLVILFGVGIFLYALFKNFSGEVTRGWTSLIASIWILGGVQLVAFGVIGEYVGQIVDEVKKRPQIGRAHV